MPHCLKLVYFASIKEKIGKSDEILDLPDHIGSVNDLIDYLSNLSPKHASAFEQRTLVKVAIDQEHVQHEAPLTGAKEVAIFPPMTGG